MLAEKLCKGDWEFEGEEKEKVSDGKGRPDDGGHSPVSIVVG